MGKRTLGKNIITGTALAERKEMKHTCGFISKMIGPNHSRAAARYDFISSELRQKALYELSRFSRNTGGDMSYQWTEIALNAAKHSLKRTPVDPHSSPAVNGRKASSFADEQSHSL